ncbi:MAG TPA: BatB protein, partial [Bacteroidales bacterium]|nr:BatB protein [Bacteroidales bacterium]
QLEFARFESRYYIFLIAAMILLMMELLIPDRKNKWLKIEKLFR